MKKRFRPGSSGKQQSGAIWLLVFSDMSTNLMLFFLLMFAMSRMNDASRQSLVKGMEKALRDTSAIEKRHERARVEREAIRMLSDTVSLGSIRQYAKMDVRDDAVKLTLAIPGFFDPGSAQLKSNAVQAVQSLAPALSRFPGNIVIEGHTDSIPISGGRFKSNWELSIARAVTVIEILEAEGVPSGRLVAGGYGEYHPAYPNDTAEHMALNRRIEVTVVRVGEDER